jgi:uncharacterized protein
MPTDLLNLALFMGLGAIAGICSGLLGIGGGMVIVPGLFFLFGLVQMPEAALMHMAAGTATCIMIFTSAASTWAHHRRGHIHWDIFQRVIGGIAAGVVVGNLMGNHLNSNLLELIFGLFLVGVATKIFLGRKPKLGEKVAVMLPTVGLATLVGIVIGFKSGVLGIGGGALSVPFLLYCGLPMSHATGTSASFTLPIAIVGTAAFMLLPGNPQEIMPWATGYVYWPAVALVAPFSMLGAPLGAKGSDVISAEKLRNLFAGFLLLISCKMLLGTGYFNFLG